METREKLPLELISPDVNLQDTLKNLEGVEDKLLDILSIAECTAKILASPTVVIDTDYKSLADFTQNYCKLVREVHQDLSEHISKIAVNPELVSSERWEEIERTRREEAKQNLTGQLNQMIDELYGVETAQSRS